MTISQHGSSSSQQGPPLVSQDAQEVHRYASQALDLITRWVDKGATDPDEPTSRWPDSASLRKSRRSNGHKARFSLGDAGVSQDETVAFLSQTLTDSVHPWTRRFLDKLYAKPTTLAPAIEMILGALNPSTVISSAAPALCLAEEECVEALARLMGWDVGLADGLTMPGGSASNILAVQTALGNAFPSFKQGGVLGVVEDLAGKGRRGKACRPLLVTSAQSHYSMEKAALACGLGLESVVKVRCDATGRMDVVELQRVLQEAYENTEGSPDRTAGWPFFIGATAGTTVLGAFDDLAGIASVVRSLQTHHAGAQPWLHVDGSWGGPVLFSSHSRRLMAGVEHADSVTINPHKALNVTQQCSFALFRHGTTLAANVTGAKYLFHGTGTGMEREALRRNPGSKTMGCGRRADAFKFYVAWLHTGASGFGGHIDQGVAMARRVADLLETGKYKETLQLAEAMPSREDLFFNVCFRPRMGEDVRTAITRSAAAQTGGGESANGSTADLIETACSRLASRATVHVHAAISRSGRFSIDRAPLSPPHGRGYYTRLISHPDTPFEVFETIVGEIARVGQAFFKEEVVSVLESGRSLRDLLREEDD
ncbi:PLP-dependent transferase [Jaminaea rosea]|uniref:PLP-dependent transferase n=1 Tax=Jaminaea rosea TaxID=1569628 RepID=A0A316UY81_9BASI|nr:PLP-dependent transferase [Jaminaea rosea]PWN29954.1 PLP-dependent transferase [Jaminaea rosea]